MKKNLLTLAVLSLLTAHVFAQGQILFSAGTGNLIKFSTDGIIATAYPGAGVSPFGTANVSFFAAVNGTQLTLSSGLPNFTSSWTPVATVLPVGGVLGTGTAFDGDLILPAADGVAGNNVEVEVVAWTGTDTTWASAVADRGTDLLGFSGDTFNSVAEGALGWSQPTTTGSPFPAAVLTGASAFNGIVLQSHVVATPEPSTVALGGAGAVILILSRFLKSRKTNSAAR